MSFRSPATAAALAALIAVSTQAGAGTSFRLEIGSPVAAGIGNKVKDYKKLVLVLRPLLCDSPDRVRVSGTAEGVVNGARRSVPLTLVAIDAAKGVYGVQQQWDDTGRWVLRLDGTCPAPAASASTIVSVEQGRFIREKTQVLREPATRAQIEAALADVPRAQRSAVTPGTVP